MMRRIRPSLNIGVEGKRTEMLSLLLRDTSFKRNVARTPAGDKVTFFEYRVKPNKGTKSVIGHDGISFRWEGTA